MNEPHLDCQDSFKHHRRTSGQHFIRLLRDHVLKIFEGELDIFDEAVGCFRGPKVACYSKVIRGAGFLCKDNCIFLGSRFSLCGRYWTMLNGIKEIFFKGMGP